ncbi:MAG: DUF3225 domain-containing protein [Burkholderiaceae bacterium]|nr:DUF3225 domain-containing protein [Microbacteriaceae bacterium]
MADDLVALDAFFAPGPDTLRGDAAGLLVGHDSISAYRVGRGGAPARSIRSVIITPIDDDRALVVSVFAPRTGGRGQQTQLWRRAAAGWVIEVAHVSAPAPAVDSRVWRTVGTPLVAPLVTPLAAGAPAGPLRGARVAVKDLFDVAGHPVGAGVPQYLAESSPASAHAPAVAALLAAGAHVQGIARTDEFAYSIAGRNPHYGTPPNPAVVGGIPGGSSNGPASAVALGQADVGLGTDTGGSIRVPASYQGLWGLRTTHGAVDRTGLLPLAPSFDTVGWLTRDAATLRAAAMATLEPGAQRQADGERADAPADARPATRRARRSRSSETACQPALRFVVAPAVTALADPEVADAMSAAFATPADAGLFGHIEVVDLGDIEEAFEVFRTVQAAEAWATHGPWIEAHPGALGEDIAARFAWASSFDEKDVTSARRALVRVRARIDDVLGDRVLLVPSASSIAPSSGADAASNERTRAGTLRMTCIAGITGRPALSAPLVWVARDDLATPAPVGLCLVGPRFSDLALISAGEAIETMLAARAKRG